MIHYYCLLFMILGSIPLQAEVYQWRDAKGKLHFSDRQPDDATFQELDVSDVNIDESREQSQKLKSVFSNRDAWGHDEARSEKKTSRSQLEKKDAQLRCAKIRQRYNEVRGAVVFVDENGRKVNVSRREADAMAAKYKTLLDKEC